MKKTIKSLLAIAITAFAFTACSDVPEPYPMPGTGGQGGGGEAGTGSGQLTDPYDCLAAINTGGTADWVYIKGKVSRVKEEYTTQYGNGTFYISNDGTTNNEFYVYRAYYLGNKKFAEGDAQIKVGDDVLICGIITNYNGTIETTQNKGFIYELNGVNRGGDPTGGGGGEQKGTGTETDPFNVAAAVAKCKAVGETATEQEFYVKGIADAAFTVPDDNYKNATFDMVDTEGASEKFKAFRVLAANGQKLKAGYVIPKGATVVVCSKLVNYKGNTAETVQTTNPAYNGTLVSVNGQAPEVEGGGGDTPTPSGKALEAGKYFFVTTATGKAQVGTPVAADKTYGYMLLADAQVADGKLANDEANLFTFTAVEGGFTLQDASGRYYYMDDSHKSFQVSATLPTANHIWTATVANDGTATVKNNGTGLVIQYVKKYSEFTPTDSGDGMPTLMKVGDAITTGGGSEGGGNEGGGNEGGGAVSGNTISVTFSDLGLANQQKPSTLTLTDGTTLTFDGGGNTNVPAYYNAGTALRMYPKNTMTIDAGSKKIAGIEIVCIENSGTMCNASGDVTVGETKMTIDGASLKFTGPNAAKATVTNTSTATGAASQIRMSTLKITYAQ